MSLGHLVRATVPAVALALTLAAPGSAQAVTVSGVVAHPIATGASCSTESPHAVTAPAATHQDLCVRFGVSGGDPRDLTVHLAPGVIGDPSATSVRCSGAQFDGGACPAESQVGTVVADATVDLVGAQTLQGKVFNLQPGPTDPALLGIDINPGLPVVSPIRLRTTIRTRLTDYGLDSVTTGIPDRATVSAAGIGLTDVAVHTTSMALTLWGTASGRGLAKPFVTLPTRCGAVTSTIDVTDTSGATASGGETFTTDQCDKVPFTPGLQVGPARVESDTPGEAFAILSVPTGDDAAGRVQANVRRVQLDLPPGLVFSPGLANGLVACTEQQFGLEEDRTPACPPESVIGSVEFDTPLIGKLTGTVFFGEPVAGQKLRNFVSVEDPRLRVKLIGGVTTDPVTGQIRNVFEDSPQVPFKTFKFVYDSGRRAVLSAPQACGTYTATAAMRPWTGGAERVPSGTFETVDCPGAIFTPSLGGDVSSTQAGGDTALTVHITRPDRQSRLLRSTVSLPPGLLGRLASVPACPIDDARRGACAADTRIGSATVTVGNGEAPIALPGTVFLTGPVDGGAAGMAIVVPAKVGPIDLGTVVSIAALKLRSADAGVDVVTEDLPQMVDGIPTVYRQIDLAIDRPGFLVNATSCAPSAFHGAFAATDGTEAGADAPYQATGCEKLPYAPVFQAVLGAKGQTGDGAHPPLVTTITQQPGQANTKRTVVTLPPGIGADPAALGRACPEEQLLANACPASAKVGTITANSSLLPLPLNGTIILVKPKGGVLPELSLELPFGIRLRATVGFAAGGRLQTVFPAIPDVALNRLRVAFDGGNGSVLRAGRDLCKGPIPTLAVEFGGHNGAARTLTVPADVPCGAGTLGRVAAKGGLRGIVSGHPTLALAVSAGGTALKELRVTLPKKLRLGSLATLRRAVQARIAAAASKRVTIRSVKGRLVVTLPKGGARGVDVTLGRGALALRRTVRVGRTLAFGIEAVPVHGKVIRTTTRLKAQR